MNDRITVERGFVNRDGSGQAAAILIDGEPAIELRRERRYGAAELGPIELSAWSARACTPGTAAAYFEAWAYAQRLYERLERAGLYRATFRTKAGEPRELYLWATGPTHAEALAARVIARWDVDDVTRARMLFASWELAEGDR